MNIQSLLNPQAKIMPVETVDTDDSSDKRSQRLDSPPSKKQRLAKDAAIFTKSRPRGSIRYPPFEAYDDIDLMAQYQKYQIHPLGRIADYCRHIPYNSEKKSFLLKTGRDCFEGYPSQYIFVKKSEANLSMVTVFQYEFKVPRDDRVYTVMWDYNIGLVRITPFFKCCNHSKVSLTLKSV